MMRPSRIISRPAGLLAGSPGELADSLAADHELLALALHWLWLHMVLGVLLIAKLALIALNVVPGGFLWRPRR